MPGLRESRSAIVQSESGALMGSISETRLLSLCQGCGKQGATAIGDREKPEWCTCTGVRKKGGCGFGPYVAAPGFVACFTFESKEDAAFRERCRLAGNERHRAKEALSDRWVKCGRGFRELPLSHPKRKALELRYRKALRAEEALQAVCRHPSRSIYFRIFCDVCHAQVECDIEHFRHLVRELGKRNAMRLAV